MIKNSIPLSSILGGFILSLSFLAGCFVFLLIYEIENDEPDNSLLIILGIFAFLCLLLAVTGMGLIWKARWARIVLLVFFYLGLIGWTGGLSFALYENGLPYRWGQMLALVTFSIFFYVIFMAGILLLNNKAFKDEFPKKEKKV